MSTMPKHLPGTDKNLIQALPAGTDSPCVSIIVTNYNGMRMLAKCLDSIEAQTFGDFEVIVVDDCSTDESLNLLKTGYPWARVLANPANLGPAAAKNRGLSAAAGRLIVFLDNDTCLDSQWLAEMIDACEHDRDCGIFAAKLLFEGAPEVLNSTGGLVNLGGYAWDRGVNEPDNGNYPEPSRVLYACSAATLIRREVFDQVGTFDELYAYPYEDTDLGWRANLAGWSVRYVPSARAWHRSAATMGRIGAKNAYLFERNRIMTLMKNLETATLRRVSKALLLLYAQRFRNEITSPRLSGTSKVEIFCGLIQAVWWNVRHAGHILRCRKRIAVMRAVPDSSLMEAELLVRDVRFPDIVKNPYVPDYVPKHLDEIDPRDHTELDMRDSSLARLGPGWYNQEIEPGNKSFRWTSAQATAFLSSRNKPRYLDIDVNLANPLEPSRVRVSVGKYVSNEIEVTPESRLLVGPLPATNGSGNGLYPVRISVSNPFVPAEIMPSMDVRELGIGIRSIGLVRARGLTRLLFPINSSRLRRLLPSPLRRCTSH